MIRRLIVPLTAAVVTFHAGQVFAQGAFPAPLPNQSRACECFAISAGERGCAAAAIGAPRRFRRFGADRGAACERCRSGRSACRRAVRQTPA